MAKPKAHTKPRPILFTDTAIGWLLAGFAFLIYFSSLWFGFVMDDRAVIEQNRLVQKGIAGIPELLTTFYWQGYTQINAGLYRPLSMVMFAVEWQLSPNNPFIHHAVNVLLYALTAWLLFGFLRKLFPGRSIWYAGVVTALFIAHPAHTEVVANIKSRDELMAFLFFICTGLALIRDKNRWGDVMAASTFFLCSLLSKESGLLFLPVFLLTLLIKGKSIKASVLHLVPLLVVAVVWFAWRTYVVKSASPVVPYSYLDNSIVGCTGWAERLGTGLTVLGRYMLKCVWPYSLSYDYSFNEIPCVSLFSLVPVIVVSVVIGLLVAAWHYRNKLPAFSFGVLFFFVTIALTANVFFLIGTTFADRLLFTPVLGFLIAMVWLLFEKFPAGQQGSPGNVVVFFLAGMLLAYSYKTVARSADWASNEQLLKHDTRVAVNSSRVHFNYGSYLLNNLSANEQQKKLQLEESIQYLQKAFQIDSFYALISLNLGTAYYRIADYKQALVYLNKARQQAPDNHDILMNYADALFMNARYDSAIAYYNLLLNDSTGTAENYNMLGTAYFNLKDYTKAEAVFRQGMALYPSYYTLWFNCGNALAASARYDEAIQAFKKAYELNPADKKILQFIAMAYRAQGDLENSQYYMQKLNGLDGQGQNFK